MVTMSTKIHFRDDARKTIARYQIGRQELADKAGIARSTLFGLLNPQSQPRRIGGMYDSTAGKIAGAFAELTNMSYDDAWTALFEEVPYQRPSRGSDNDADEVNEAEGEA